MPAGPPPSSPSDSAPARRSEGLPLGPGSSGQAVEDLQARLVQVGLDAGDDGVYGATTEEAVRRFQEQRGIRVDGVCGRQTWTTVVEAGWRLGDRLLYERVPLLRGDDVHDLQERLGGLGFLEDKVDGILGPQTRSALQDFQRNCGLTVDGICGPQTVAELVRLGNRAPTAVKAGVVERARLRSTPRRLAGRRVLIGDLGGVGALTAAVEQALHHAGAQTSVTAHPDGSQQAVEANALGVDLYVGLTVAVGDVARCAYYSTARFTSEGGQRLAGLLAAGLEDSTALATSVAVTGMRLPVLRETRMPAVVCELAPVRSVVERGGTLAEVVRAAAGQWFADPLSPMPPHAGDPPS